MERKWFGLDKWKQLTGDVGGDADQFDVNGFDGRSYASAGRKQESGSDNTPNGHIELGHAGHLQHTSAKKDDHGHPNLHGYFQVPEFHQGVNGEGKIAGSSPAYSDLGQPSRLEACTPLPLDEEKEQQVHILPWKYPT